ncbi:MAG: ABC transporter permease [Candidatus Omnitrophica bacterium]|nr:ABC transporter permease [Candidatus Omnitrophota bacterium]
MRRYIKGRLIAIIPMLLGISLISFAVIRLAPGGPVELATALNPKVSLEARQRFIEQEHFDKPIVIHYGIWLKGMLTCDFGYGRDGRKVIVKIAERIPITFLINILSIFLILLIAIPLGISSAVKKNSLYDRSMTVFVFIGFAMPGFWLALILMSLFGIKLGWLPVQGVASLDFDNLSAIGKFTDIAKHLVLPVFVSAFGGLAGMSRYMRSNMLEVLHKDYIRTARAKGLPEQTVIYKHALKNAVLPVVTILGLSIPGLIGGSVIFETIFGIPGIGRLYYESAMSRDINVIMALLIISAVLTLIGNLLADLSYALVDPRIRYEKAN